MVVVVIIVQGGTEALPVAVAIMGPIWLLTMAMRWDVIALQFGRPIRYELQADRFLAYRGSKLVCSFRFADVKEWVAASPASTMEYWLGWGFWRSGYFLSTLPRYSFTLSDDMGKQMVNPPALFRWRDRGGLQDVTYALFERLGPPINYSTGYFTDHRRSSSHGSNATSGPTAEP